MSSPKFSILMPVVKTRYFREAFDSAAAQIHPDFEIVVLDNRADADVGWVTGHAKARLIRNEAQLPPSKNWNKGIAECRGEYVILLSDDDLLTPDCLKDVAEFVSRNPVEVIRVMRTNIDAQGRHLGFSCPGRETESLSEYVYNQYFFKRGQVISDLVFQREAALAIGGFRDLPHAWGADHLFAIELAAARNRIGNLNKVCMHYRVHAANISNHGSVQVDIRKMDADDRWTALTQKLLDATQDAYSEMARKTLAFHRQCLQDAHYVNALAHGGVFGLRKLHRANGTTLGSRKRSLAKAVVAAFGRLSGTAKGSIE